MLLSPFIVRQSFYFNSHSNGHMNGSTRQALKNFRETVKLLCGFLTAIALTNAISQFATLQKTAGPGHLSIIQSVSFFFLMWLICRFFFGNIVHLITDSDNDPLEIVIDGITILAENLLLAYMTHFATDPKRLFVYVCLLMFFDLIWWIISASVAKLRNRKLDIDRRVSVSQVASMLTVACFIGLGTNIRTVADFWWFNYTLNATATAWIAIGNTAVDFLLNGPRYFGLKWVRPHLQSKVEP